MAVRIFVNGGSCKVSLPFRSLQDLRITILKRVVIFLERKENEEGSDEDLENLSDALRECINFDTQREESIRYEKFEKLGMLFLVNHLIGIFKFVNHSDYDGYHTFGDAFDILESFQSLTRSFPHLLEEKYFPEFFKIFSEAKENHKHIEYC